jgi:hypothetical protein
MAICDVCKKEMTEGVSCVKVKYRIGGELFDAIKYGDEPADDIAGFRVDWRSKQCHDCRTPKGGYHHPGCDQERCPKCGCQLISCDCDIEEEIEDEDE